MSTVENFFSDDGPLSRVIKGFKPRKEQTNLAETINAAINEKSALVAEAGTGTGKTFAYLAPALLSKKRFIVSTGTKNLQEQLFHRDLPLVKKAIDQSKQAALLKGRSNYACMHRIAQYSGGNALLDKQILHDFSLVKSWSTTTVSGDIAELKTVKEDSKVIPIVTSTVDNCLGRECKFFEDCFLVKARKKALEADVIVVNHHLFFADLALKDTGFGELIPSADLVVFDEAHQVPDIASEYFGINVSSRQLNDVLRDMIALQKTMMKDAQQLSRASEKAQQIIADLRLLFPLEPTKGNWEKRLSEKVVTSCVDAIKKSLEQVIKIAAVHQGREKDLDVLIERLLEYRDSLVVLTDTTQTAASLWYETTQRHVILHLTPLSISDKFEQVMNEQDCAWVFTSATLMVGNDFSHFQSMLGLNNSRTLKVGSPFDYMNQAMLCIPRYLPEPSDFSIKTHVTDIALRLIEASKGRAFILFTSHAMMRETADKIRSMIDTPILVQGESTKQELLKCFLNDKHSVLLATGAFWEGVDVKGSDLRCVMIDKLPFASPDDPLLQARIEDCKKRGGNAFAEIQIPQAVIALKQGAGRLIRDQSDKGVLVICDNRIVTKNYGADFVESLPNMRRTRDLDLACEFLADIK